MTKGIRHLNFKTARDTKCPFCDDAAREDGRKFNVYIEECEDFYILADISPLIFGHLLIIPKIHLSSYGQLPTSQYPGLVQTVKRCVSMISGLAENFVIAEHGSSFGEGSAACCEHAHLHVLPCNNKQYEIIVSEYEKAGGMASSISFPSDLLFLRDTSYLLLSNSVDTAFVWGCSARFKRQMFRYVFAGQPEDESLFCYRQRICRAGAEALSAYWRKNDTRK